MDYDLVGRELLSLIETTDMQKVYKMPVLYSFYNHGNIRISVTDDEVLAVRTIPYYKMKKIFNRFKNLSIKPRNI